MKFSVWKHFAEFIFIRNNSTCILDCCFFIAFLFDSYSSLYLVVSFAVISTKIFSCLCCSKCLALMFCFVSFYYSHNFSLIDFQFQHNHGWNPQNLKDRFMNCFTFSANSSIFFGIFHSFLSWVAIEWLALPTVLACFGVFSWPLTGAVLHISYGI